MPQTPSCNTSTLQHPSLQAVSRELSSAEKHTAAPALDILPASQLRHAETDVAPAPGEYLPGVHEEHSSESSLE